ncbi:MAG: phage GP46 family protein [Enterobacter sp.]|uniref:phage GP46 family protein n=1 Tax=Enterobacter TaxID=547 RepID=UPI0021C8B803|nr:MULTISPECIES: phage GP46 family protein [Enterobacter]MCU4026031.1 phage GP46 family protein [Enterobacter roggenkampii]MDU6057544.1 phage GP46 family protein [Enterobacter sp.]
MSDIASFWNVDEMFADWQKGLGELTTGNDLQTAILASLFTDRLARADDDYEDSDRRGWWGDSGEESQLGSRLWLLRRKKLTPDVAKKAEEYSSEALNWLKVDGVVSEVIPVARIVLPDRLNLIIRYQAPGNDWQEFRFYWIWEQR